MLRLPDMTPKEKEHFDVFSEIGDAAGSAGILAAYIQRCQAAVAAESSRLAESTVSSEFPLFPSLSDAGTEEAQALLDRFVDELRKAADGAISNFYSEILCTITSDSWTNFRNLIVDGFRDYPRAKKHLPYDFKNIRDKIFQEHREEILRDIAADLVEEVRALKEENERIRNSRFRL